jgi:hypothetical protein
MFNSIIVGLNAFAYAQLWMASRLTLFSTELMGIGSFYACRMCWLLPPRLQHSAMRSYSEEERKGISQAEI